MTAQPTEIHTISTAMLGLLMFFEDRCSDQATLKKLIELTEDGARRGEAHALFSEIRGKTLIAIKRGDRPAQIQYAFEEICAKTLYNLSYPLGPFDPDSPFWILPFAIRLAQSLGVSDPGEISPLLK